MSATTNAAPAGNWGFPTKIRFGVGRIAELPDACKAAGIRRPLIVTDPGLAKLPMIERAPDALQAAGLEPGLFTGVDGNPTAANVEAGVAAYKAENHDGVIAWGGGSALDAGKAIAFMPGQTRPIWDFEDIGDYWTRADADAIAPVVAAPTTSGTGSEVGRASVILDEEKQVKKVIFHPKMLPVEVIADPALTVGLPPDLTAWTGMDALAHCLEAFCARGFHPMARGIAVEGLRLIKDALPRAVADGRDLEARAHMLAAAEMGATAFQRGLGAIHALSHPVGALFNSHHGLTNAVFMPYVLAANRPAIESDLDALARVLDLPKPGYVGVMDWVLSLREEIGIPHTTESVGVKPEAIARIAAMSIDDPTAGGNPVKVTVEYSTRVLEASLAGMV